MSSLCRISSSSSFLILSSMAPPRLSSWQETGARIEAGEHASCQRKGTHAADGIVQRGNLLALGRSEEAAHGGEHVSRRNLGLCHTHKRCGAHSLLWCSPGGDEKRGRSSLARRRDHLDEEEAAGGPSWAVLLRVAPPSVILSSACSNGRCGHARVCERSFARASRWQL